MTTQRIISIDTETSDTLKNPKAEIISIGLCLLSSDLSTIQSQLELYIVPQGPVSPEAAAINGYTPELWAERGAVEPHLAACLIKSWLRNTIIEYAVQLVPLAHNAAFDKSMLERFQNTVGMDFPLDYHWHCSMNLFHTWLFLSKQEQSCGLKSLATACGHWTEEEAAQKHHGALEDARACADGFSWLIQKYWKAVAA